MSKMFACTLYLSAAMLLGCHSNEKKSSATADASNAAHAGHEPEVCDVPGMGTPTKAVAQGATLAVYGGQQKLSDADAVPAAKVIASPDQYKDKYVRITGKVSSVCDKKGCWLRVVPDQTAGNAASKTDIFIKFRDPPAGRLIPMEAVGKNVIVEGTLKEGTLSEAAARHFLEDGGASKEEIEKIVGPQKQLMVAGPVVAIEGVQKAE